MGYLITGVAWIAFSDRTLSRFISDPATLTEIQTYKGIGFVLVTSVLLYLIVWGAFWLRGRVMHRTERDLRRAYEQTIEGWARTLALRDDETEGHARRVTDLAVRLAMRMGVEESDLIHIWRGALLHDIGKIGIPDSILLKPGKLNEAETTVMRRHPEYALHLLAPIEYLRPALAIPYCHHERWDGSGYPRGLAGNEIPLAARIFAVVDAWDALRSDRPYRRAWSARDVRVHMRARAGSDFDPEVVGAFLWLLDDLEVEKEDELPMLTVIEGGLSA